MKKFIISVLGKDRPGIIAGVTRVLFEKECNLENVSQTILQKEFSGVFLLSTPDAVTPGELVENLKKHTYSLNLDFHVKEVETDPGTSTPEPDCEPFAITTKGPDKKGLVARITKIFARYGVNVTNLQAVFKGGNDPGANVMIYQVDIPNDIDHGAFRKDLRDKAKELELDVSIQHKNIFEAINRI